MEHIEDAFYPVISFQLMLSFAVSSKIALKSVDDAQHYIASIFTPTLSKAFLLRPLRQKVFSYALSRPLYFLNMAILLLPDEFFQRSNKHRNF